MPLGKPGKAVYAKICKSGDLPAAGTEAHASSHEELVVPMSLDTFFAVLLQFVEEFFFDIKVLTLLL